MAPLRGALRAFRARGRDWLIKNISIKTKKSPKTIHFEKVYLPIQTLVCEKCIIIKMYNYKKLVTKLSKK